MADVIIIQDEKAKYAENLFSYKSTLNDNDINVNIVSGGSSAVVDIASVSVPLYNKKRSVRAIFTDTSVCTFNLDNALLFTAPFTGNYVFSVRIYIPTTYSSASIYGKIASFINSLSTDFNFTCQNNDFIFGQWNTFSQNVYLNQGDTFNSDIKIQSDTVGSRMYFGGFKMAFDDRGLNGIAPFYSEPTNQTTGYKSKVDTSNTQNLTANTDNLISFTGVESSNGGLNIMNSNGKITPIKLGDVLVTDFVFTFPSPSGTTDFLSVKLKVNGVIYRAQSFQILEPTGETNYVAVSFTLPVEADFLQYGAEFFINPNVAITISNRYLQVTRVHKAV